MKNNKINILLGAVVAGVLAGASVARANDTVCAGRQAELAAKNGCSGQNGCRGSGNCRSTVDRNDCGGQNGCHGQGHCHSVTARR